MLARIKETQRTYDLIAAEYAKSNSGIDIHPQIIEDIESLAAALPLGSVVADVGCGPGRETVLLREQELRVVGLDLSIEQLRIGGRTGVAQADMCELPLHTGSVDGIWCQAALLHVPHATVRTVLGEFARVVRCGGRLCLVVAEGAGERWEIASKYGAKSRRWYSYHRESHLTSLLASVGFAVDRVRRTRSGRDWISVHAFRA